jgi:membrane protein insertase Oxa1/YidC/SpoIIIJ
MELQTVDGQGAQSQKMMTYMMPIMMAVFAFMYTAAFCIYIVLSSVISIGTTFMINGIIDLKYKNQKAQEKPQVVRGRVYVPKEEPKKEEPKKKSKAQKEKENDGFLSGKFDKKKR